MDQEDCAVSKARFFLPPFMALFWKVTELKMIICFNLERVLSSTWRIDFVVVKQDGVKMC